MNPIIERMELSHFHRMAEQAPIVPLYLKIGGEFLTPQMAYLKLRSPDKPSFLLESALRGEQVGRYSFVGFHPRGVLCHPFAEPLRSPSFFEKLHTTLENWRSVPWEQAPPLCGGLVGYIGYDLVREIEPLPPPPGKGIPIPDACLGVYPRIIAFDHLKNEIWFLYNLILQPDEPLDGQYRRGMEHLEHMLRQLESRPIQRGVFQAHPSRMEGNFSKDRFLQAVSRAREYIFAGEIFQIVLSQRFTIPFSGDPFPVYQALRRLNPSPYMFYLDFGEFQLIGSSPEMLVRQDDREVEVVPIAGTRRRGRNQEEDDRMARELKADPKELAEHMMLVDLARNDLGRIARRGSIRVEDMATVERYSHVMHIISRVLGTATAATSMVDTFRAVFPAGTVSGAPKIRAMEIINQLEPEKRGFYAGSVGYFDVTGRMNHCIAIRTILARAPFLYLQAGAGIVADSQPEREYQETLHKIQALRQAVTIAAGEHP